MSEVERATGNTSESFAMCLYLWFDFLHDDSADLYQRLIQRRGCSGYLSKPHPHLNSQWWFSNSSNSSKLCYFLFYSKGITKLNHLMFISSKHSSGLGSALSNDFSNIYKHQPNNVSFLDKPLLRCIQNWQKYDFLILLSHLNKLCEFQQMRPNIFIVIV